MEYVNTGLASILYSIALLAALLELCRRHGRRFIRLVGAVFPEGFEWEERFFSVFAGLYLFGTAFWIWGSSIGLSQTALIVFWVIFAGSAFLPYRKPQAAAASAPTSSAFGSNPILISLFLIPTLLSFWECTKPPIGNDALAYHLAHPKLFLENQRIGYLLHTRESLWPYLTEMWFTAALFLQGTTLAHLFHWLFYPACAGLLFIWARKQKSAFAGWAAALVFLYTPAAFSQSSDAYVDLSLAFFSLASVYFAHQRGLFSVRSAACLSGVFCGAALSIKYLALGIFMPLALYWCIAERKRLYAPVIFAASCAAACGGWYLKSWAVLGNPVYPFAAGIFGGQGFDFGLSREVGLGASAPNLLLFLWNLTMMPDRFGGPMIGPTYLLFLLPALLQSSSRKLFFGPLAVAAFFLLFIFYQAQQARFMLAVLPFFALPIGVWLSENLNPSQRLRTRVMIGIIYAVLCLHLAIFIYRVSKDAWVGLKGEGAAREFLLRRERSFRGHDFLTTHVQPGQKVFIVDEARRFYASSYEADYDEGALRLKLTKNGKTLIQFLRDSNYDFIWISDRSDPQILIFLKEAAYEKVFEYQFTEEPATFVHTIYMKASSG